MDSGTERRYGRLLDKAVERNVIDEEGRRRLALMWSVVGWKKTLLDFYRLMLGMASLVIAICVGQGIRALVNWRPLRDVLERLWAGIVYAWNTGVRWGRLVDRGVERFVILGEWVVGAATWYYAWIARAIWHMLVSGARALEFALDFFLGLVSGFWGFLAPLFHLAASVFFQCVAWIGRSVYGALASSVRGLAGFVRGSGVWLLDAVVPWMRAASLTLLGWAGWVGQTFFAAMVWLGRFHVEAAKAAFAALCGALSPAVTWLIGFGRGAVEWFAGEVVPWVRFGLSAAAGGVGWIGRTVFDAMAWVGRFHVEAARTAFEAVYGALSPVVAGLIELARGFHAWWFESFRSWTRAALSGLAATVGWVGWVGKTVHDAMAWLGRFHVEAVKTVIAALYEALSPAVLGVGGFIRGMYVWGGESVVPWLRWAISLAGGGLGWIGRAVFGSMEWMAGIHFRVGKVVFDLVYGACAPVGLYYAGAVRWVGALQGRLVVAVLLGLRDALDAVAEFLIGSVRWIATFDYQRLMDIYETLAWWYWINVASEKSVLVLLLVALALDGMVQYIARKPRLARLAAYGQVVQAAAFTWMLGHIVELFSIHCDWGGLEIASMGLWVMLPLMIAVMTGRRAFFYEIIALALLTLHLLVYASGVTGNVLVAFDLSLAVAVISLADILQARLGSRAAVLRYYAMGAVGFLLYCGGVVWDLVDILELRSHAAASSLDRSGLFLIPAVGVAAALAGIAYWRKGAGRTRHDTLFCLLLLATLGYGYFPTGILLRSISVGEIYDLGGTVFGMGIFAVNVLLITMLAWVMWFGWCLWLLLESSDRNSGLMAQIVVAAMLCSLETKYVEIVIKVSFTAGLTVLPVMALLVSAAMAIIRRWQDRLGGELVPVAAGEG